eukprot:767457-Hanusia_phi.AAC.1
MERSLLAAAREGDAVAVNAMLDSSADPNFTDEDGWSPLIMAAKVRDDERRLPRLNPCWIDRMGEKRW